MNPMILSISKNKQLIASSRLKRSRIRYSDLMNTDDFLMLQ